MNINLQRLSAFKTIREVKTDYSYDKFRHPELLKEELRLGYKLGLYSWADTGCAVRHAHVEEFVLGKMVTATGFSSSLEGSWTIYHLLMSCIHMITQRGQSY